MSDHWFVVNGDNTATLRGHEEPVWFGDGETVPLGLKCRAISESATKRAMGHAPERCPKAAIVRVHGCLVGGDADDCGEGIDLCGGHFDVHRRGDLRFDW